QPSGTGSVSPCIRSALRGCCLTAPCGTLFRNGLRAKDTYDRRLNNTEIGTHCSLRSALPVRSVRHVGLFLRQLRPLDRVNALVPIAFDFFLVRGVERLLQPIENRFGWILAMAAS